MIPAADLAQRADQTAWLLPEPDLPDWANTDPRQRLHEVTRGLTEEHTFALAALTIFDSDAGAWRLEAVSVSAKMPALQARIAQANLCGRTMRLKDAPLARAAVADDGAGPELIISQQLADLLDPIVCAAPRDPGPAIRVWTTVPLWVGSHLLGTLTAGATQEELSEAQQELMQAFAGQAVLALSNSVLWERAYASLRRSREAERRYRNLLESSADAIFLLDADGRFVYLNRQAEALSGYQRAELQGSPFYRLTPAEARPELQRITERILAGETLPVSLDLTLVTKAGKEAPIEVSLTPLRSQGRLDTVQIVARDIRQRLLHEQERERLLAQSQEMSRRLRASFAQIGAALARSGDLPGALQLIAQFAGELLSADLTTLWLRGEEGQLSLAATACGQGAPADRDPRQWVSERFIEHVVTQKSPLRFSGPSAPANRCEGQEGPAEGGAQEQMSGLGIPLTASDHALGALAVARRQPADFSDTEVELLASFAHQASIAIEQARLFDRLYQKGRECETIVRNSADGIAVLDRQRRIIDFNPALQRILGYSAEQLLGRRCWETFQLGSEGPSSCGEKCPYNERWAADLAPLLTHQVQRPDGRLITIAVSYGLVRDSEGQISRVIATVRDVTKQAELDRMRNEFISGVSHELRTPLALLKGYVSTLLRSDITIAPAVQRRFLQNISQACDRLDRLIGDLLTVSRLEAGRLTMDFHPHDLVALARQVVEQARVQYPDLPIEFTAPATPVRVQMDAGRIEQVLSNLISNAAKFSPPDQPVRVLVERAGDVARVSVSDSGAGIAPEHQEHLFEKFYRVTDRAVRQSPGLGLGLHISKGIIDAHGGRIWVYSKPGVGSVFGFDLHLLPEGA